MGTTYESTLVVADFTEVAEAVNAAGRPAVVLPVAPGRVAILPREGPRMLARELSTRLEGPILVSFVSDSEYVDCLIYTDGRCVHRYVSAQEAAVEWLEDDNGGFRPVIDGTVYPAEHPVPKGPLGDDPAAFAPFAVGPPKLERIRAALRGDISLGDEHRRMAEDQHWAIMQALNLPTESLALGQHFNQLDPARHPKAVLIEGALQH